MKATEVEGPTSMKALWAGKSFASRGGQGASLAEVSTGRSGMK